MKKIYTIAISLLLLTMGCEEVDVPKPSNDKPVFSVQFELNDVEKKFTIGKDDYIIQTDFEVNDLGVPIYTSIIRMENCPTPDCEKMVFKFNGDHLYKRDITFDRSFHKGNWDYKWRYEDKFLHLKVKTDAGIRESALERWRNQSQTISDWVKVNPFDNPRRTFKWIPSPKFLLCRDIKNNRDPIVFSSCKSVKQTDLVGRFNDSLRVTIQIAKIPRKNKYILFADAKGVKFKRNLIYNWSSNVSGNKNRAKVQLDGLAGKTISVTVIDPETNQKAQAILHSKGEILPGTPMRLPISTGFVIQQAKQKENPDKLNLGEVSILYSNKGVSYFSSAYKQPNESYFRVLSIEDYEEKGKLYKKIQIEFSAVLTTRGGEIKLSKGKGIIVLPLPER